MFQTFNLSKIFFPALFMILLYTSSCNNGDVKTEIIWSKNFLPCLTEQTTRHKHNSCSFCVSNERYDKTESFAWRLNIYET